MLGLPRELPASSGNYVWIGSETPKIKGFSPESNKYCKKYTYQDHDYYVCKSQGPMFAAQLMCQLANMELAAITSKGEALAVADFIAKQLGSSKSAWIGASNKSAAGTWTWDALQKQFWQGDASGS